MRVEGRHQDPAAPGNPARHPQPRRRPRPYARIPRDGGVEHKGEHSRTAAAPRSPTHRQWTPLARGLIATGDHWTLAIALQLAPGAVRLTRLRDRLPGISTGVLDRYLQQMVALGLLSRTRFREMPPRVELELTDSGRELLPIAAALARWGMRHVWSEPRVGEQIDVSALLRMLPVLLEEEMDLPDGILETVLEDPEQAIRHVFQIECGQLRATDGSDHVPSARVAGHTDAWIAALGPACDYERLRFSGDEELARSVLDARSGHL
jgi:DNA-binding HxlR family transcriptional regulator